MRLVTHENVSQLLTEYATALCPADRDLATIVDAWPALPEAIRAGILAMIKAASVK
jgi:hypothetical protein